MYLVICILACVAKDLDFARMQNVVNAGIGTANIMYEPDSDTVKIIGFGIARFTNSSKSKTGMVLGTPSHLSPGLLTGIKVDGSTGLFSLGFMLYQALSGSLRDQAKSMASLIFNLGSEETADIRSACAGIPRAAVTLVNRAPLNCIVQHLQSGPDYAGIVNIPRKQRS